MVALFKLTHRGGWTAFNLSFTLTKVFRTNQCFSVLKSLTQYSLTVLNPYKFSLEIPIDSSQVHYSLTLPAAVEGKFRVGTKPGYFPWLIPLVLTQHSQSWHYGCYRMHFSLVPHSLFMPHCLLLNLLKVVSLSYTLKAMRKLGFISEQHASFLRKTNTRPM